MPPRRFTSDSSSFQTPFNRGAGNKSYPLPSGQSQRMPSSPPGNDLHSPSDCRRSDPTARRQRRGDSRSRKTSHPKPASSPEKSTLSRMERFHHPSRGSVVCLFFIRDAFTVKDMCLIDSSALLCRPSARARTASRRPVVVKGLPREIYSYQESQCERLTPRRPKLRCQKRYTQCH